MKTIEFLRDYPELFWPPCLAALCLAVLCSSLSVLVVLKRLAFIGQGISHAGFGGIGVAAVFGLAAADLSPAGILAQFGVVVAFCIASALSVGALSAGRGAGKTHEDTAIGIILVASMALGSLLVREYAPTFQWENFLFGYLMNTGKADATVAGVIAASVTATLWIVRRPLTFWAFDEPSATAAGVASGRMRFVLMVLLGLATVAAMRLAGVVLASALLVLPGATALKLSTRLAYVLLWSLITATLGVIAGLIVAFELNWPPGPGIVVSLCLMYAGATAWQWSRRAW